MREMQLKFLEAMLKDLDPTPDETAGDWFLISDVILNIPEKYPKSTHPCFVRVESRLSPYGLVKVFIRSASVNEVAPPEYLHHQPHSHFHSCPLKKEGVVSLIRPARIGAANFRFITPKCTELDEDWRRYFFACLKKVS
jgi:hypothetical protein